jgi:hypothetical protein
MEGFMMLCNCREPSLNELMQEPIVRAVMARDAVEESELRDLIGRLRLLFGTAAEPAQTH